MKKKLVKQLGFGVSLCACSYLCSAAFHSACRAAKIKYIIVRDVRHPLVAGKNRYAQLMDDLISFLDIYLLLKMDINVQIFVAILLERTFFRMWKIGVELINHFEICFLNYFLILLIGLRR